MINEPDVIHKKFRRYITWGCVIAVVIVLGMALGGCATYDHAPSNVADESSEEAVT